MSQRLNNTLVLSTILGPFLLMIFLTFISAAAAAAPPPPPPTTTNQIHGTLIVTTKVIDLRDNNNKKNPSDFTITVHGNDPSPSSFPGSSSGTAVKLQMGMYSVTETGPPGYNSTLTGDCSGGVMSAEPKQCNIMNSYSSKAVVSNNATTK